MWAIQLYEHPILDLFLRKEKISLGGGPGSCYSWICPCAIEMAWPLDQIRLCTSRLSPHKAAKCGQVRRDFGSAHVKQVWGEGGARSSCNCPDLTAKCWRFFLSLYIFYRFYFFCIFLGPRAQRCGEGCGEGASWERDTSIIDHIYNANIMS